MSTFTPPSADFWRGFVAEYWEKRPTVIKNAFGGPITTPQELLRGVQEATARFHLLDSGVRLRLYHGTGCHHGEPGSQLPAAEDKTLRDYVARLRSQLGGRECLLVINTLQRYAPELWRRFLELLSGLYPHTGLPADMADLDIFIGQYRRTPFGVHKDTASNFTFVIEGEKNMRVWPDEAFPDREMYWEDSSHVQQAHVERMRDSSLLLRGEPGDVIYWPSSYWHVAESEDACSVTLNLALYLQAKPSALLLQAATMLLEQELEGEEDVRVPEGLSALARRFTQRLSAQGEHAEQGPTLEGLVEELWLRKVSGFGFRTVPEPLPPRPLVDDTLVRGDPRFPIHFKDLGNGELVCAALGHSRTLVSHPAMVGLLERLNSGQPARVRELIDGFLSEAGEEPAEAGELVEDLRGLLQELYTWRALEVVDSRGG